MGRPSDTREVLIAEALGDFVKVLDRIDAVTPTLDKSCSQLKLTADRLAGNIAPFQERIVKMALETQDRADAHIVQQANLVGQKTIAEQTAAMQESARRIFKDEIIPPLERIAGRLREANLRQQPAWATWLTHAAAAVSAASRMYSLMLYLAPTGASEARPVASDSAPDCVAPTPPPLKARDRR